MICSYQVDLPPKHSDAAGEPARYYVVHEPSGFKERASPFAKRPLLFYCHGKDETAWYSAVGQTHWRQLANAHNFVVVYGQSKG